MFKYNIFVNALRLRKGIDYPMNKNEIEMTKPIAISAMVALVNTYTARDYSSYSIPHMLKEYANGNFEITISAATGHFTYGDVDIYAAQEVPSEEKKKVSTGPLESKLREFDRCTLFDDVVFERAETWYIYYKGEITGSEILAISGNKARKVGNGHPKSGKAYFYSSAVFTKFAIEELGFEELYRILPTKRGYKSYTCVNALGSKDKAVLTWDIVEKLNNEYTKFIYTRENVAKFSIEQLKEIYYGE